MLPEKGRWEVGGMKTETKTKGPNLRKWDLGLVPKRLLNLQGC